MRVNCAACQTIDFMYVMEPRSPRSDLQASLVSVYLVCLPQTSPIILHTAGLCETRAVAAVQRFGYHSVYFQQGNTPGAERGSGNYTLLFGPYGSFPGLFNTTPLQYID